MNRAPEDRRISLIDVRDLEALRELREVWDELAADAGLFMSFDWMDAWWIAFGHELQMHILVISSGSRIVALAPLSRTPGSIIHFRPAIYRFLSDGSGDADNLDVLVRPGWESEAAAALAEWLERESGPGEILELRSVLPGSTTAAVIMKLLRNRNWRILEDRSARLIVRLEADLESHLDKLSPATRALIRRRRRQTLGHGAHATRCTSADGARTTLRALFDLHERRHRLEGSSGHFTNEQRRHFYEILVARLVEREELELWSLERDGDTIAVQLGATSGGTFYPLQEGFEPDAASCSPGLVLQSAIFEDLIRRGIRIVDFQQGDEDFKRRWGAREEYYLHFRCAPPGTVSALLLRGPGSFGWRLSP